MKRKRRNSIFKRKYTNLILVSSLILVAVISLTIGWSSFSQKLYVNDIMLNVEPETRILVTGIQNYTRMEGIGGVDYGSSFDETTITTNFLLPDKSTAVIYEVEITNFGNVEMGILEVTGLPEGYTYALIEEAPYNDYRQYNHEKICGEDRCILGARKNILIVIAYNNDYTPTESDLTQPIETTLNFDFRPYHTVTYEGIDNTNNQYPTEVIDGGLLSSIRFSDPPENIVIYMGDAEYKANATDDLKYNPEMGYMDFLVPITDDIIITATELLPEPNPPVLVDGLIPVRYDEDQRSWVVVDPNSKWYNYDKQEWANAVMLNSGYSGTVGQALSMDAIRAMFVWIPRFAYAPIERYGKGGTQDQPGEIQVKFIKGTDYFSDEIYSRQTGFSGYSTGLDYISGFWVGKFHASANVGTSYVIHPSFPRLYAGDGEPARILDHILLAEQFGHYLNWNLTGTVISDNEWDAVAYLSQSRYGKYGNKNYSGVNKRIYPDISPSSSYKYYDGLTEYPGIVGTEDCSYDNITDRGDGKGSCGGGASTTGNIYGVYNMGGSIWPEYVLGVIGSMDGRSFTISVGSSGFSDAEAAHAVVCHRVYAAISCQESESGSGETLSGEYVDAHLYFDSSSSYQGSYLGEEWDDDQGSYYVTQFWYGDEPMPITFAEPWVMRGYGNIFNRSAGIGNTGMSLIHVVLLPNE